MTDAESKVLSASQALVAAGVPHAIGGAIALGHYAEPRPIRDIDVNVFVGPERRAEVEAALAGLGGEGPPIHLFFDEDELHGAMPAAVREVPFAGATIPIVGPEHLVIRKLMLDRPKDRPDIEAILSSETSLDLDEIKRWLHLAADPEAAWGRLREQRLRRRRS